MRCRHVLCALCVERSILYHHECPVCSAPTGEPPVDVEHDELMRMRLSGVSPMPRMLTAWQRSLADAESERRRSLRVLLEFGSIVGTGETLGKTTVFLGLIRSASAGGRPTGAK